MCRLARPRVKKSRFGRQGNWGEGRRPLQSCCVIALPYVATRRAHIYFGGRVPMLGRGEGGYLGRRPYFPGAHLPPQGWPDPEILETGD